MKIEIIKSASGWLIIGACVVCWGSAIAAQPEQKVQTNTPKEITESRSVAKIEPAKVAKPVVLARSTNSKVGSVASTPPAKPLTAEEKKAVSRCWKRLMSMVREVNHAHRAKK